MEHAPAWLTSSLIYLAAAVVAVPLARALGLGSIIGYLAAGIVLGPWGLGIVSNVEAILHFAELGVVLMLFLVGLELEPRRLWSLRRSIFGWGSVQVLGCAALLFLVATLLAGASWRIGLVAALGLALSSTAVALQVMAERNLLPTMSGQAGLSILLFQDVAAIPILALLPLLAESTAATHLVAGGGWLAAAKIVAVVGAVVLGGRLLLRPLLRWIARSRTPEIFTAAALLLVVATAALMQFVGLSMALGAFLAGVLLADSEYRTELETDIEPFKGLLLGLFFIAVGMSIDFGVLLASPALVALAVAGFLAVKAIVIALLARRIELPAPERPVFVLLLAQGGEFAFVVFQAAAASGVLQARTSSFLVAVVAISMLLSPVLLVIADRMPRTRGARPASAPGEILEQQQAPVIIAGFGRYGQIVGRLLAAQGIASTVLDHDADMIATARAFGYEVFYGDATRLDLLRTAGGATARVLVVAVDDVRQSLEIVELARTHFPQLEIVARARDVTHWNELRDRGVRKVERELFESSLRSGRTVLEVLGLAPHEARMLAMRFRRANLQLFERMYPHHADRAKVIAVTRQARRQLQEQLAVERAASLARQREEEQERAAR
ncbi:glutathione-regulated potassium-efflux system protein KefC [Ramlibacter sp. RBP-2]|uniref:Glutathione-regulated potassium-efflux system protein KefC n=1 Tax=Ramlibacter lithotrophicus TaxID=2606681 RepID=A0A7X6DIB2_9BURK|nr:glutathione-regulated potassium-efflux system protein KefC [Ramlibacter lithotrophicus]NKE67687.1 glutathione-regulated potassium-efflux system protein KefC [Ramlibacter lithotrophicus]